MTEKRTPIAKLRRQILNNRGVTPAKHTKKMVPVEDMPDAFPKTDKMKYLERKYRCKIESAIFTGSLNDTVEFFQGEIERSTVSKWRKYVNMYLGGNRHEDTSKE